MKLYSINEIAMMTNLTTRTLRNYIQMGILKGEKIDGIWKFSAEDFSEFITNPNVRPSIQSKKKALIFDFLADEHKKENEICMILDLYVTAEESHEIADFFCKWINQHNGEKIEFRLEQNNRNTRIFICGTEDLVMEVMNDYYKR